MPAMTSTRKQYDRFASAYHQKRADAPRSFYNSQVELPMMQMLLRGHVRGRTILELGCGSGLLTRRLVRMGGKVTGVDNSSSMMAIAQQEVAGATFLKADIRRLKLKATKYDLIVSSLTFHYIKDLGPLFTACSRYLKRGGRLIFSLHHPIASARLMERSTRRSGYFAAGAPYRWQMLPGMQLVSYHQTFESIVHGLAKAGFVVEQVSEGKPSPFSRRVNPQAYAETAQNPPFLGIKAIKLAVPSKD